MPKCFLGYLEQKNVNGNIPVSAPPPLIGKFHYFFSFRNLPLEDWKKRFKRWSWGKFFGWVFGVYGINAGLFIGMYGKGRVHTLSLFQIIIYLNNFNLNFISKNVF